MNFADGLVIKTSSSVARSLGHEDWLSKRFR
jgi:hypothetical protein